MGNPTLMGTIQIHPSPRKVLKIEIIYVSSINLISDKTDLGVLSLLLKLLKSSYHPGKILAGGLKDKEFLVFFSV